MNENDSIFSLTNEDHEIKANNNTKDHILEDFIYDESILHQNYVQNMEPMSLNQHPFFAGNRNISEVEDMLNLMSKQHTFETEQFEIKINDLQEEIKILNVSLLKKAIYKININYFKGKKCPEANDV